MVIFKFRDVNLTNIEKISFYWRFIAPPLHIFDTLCLVSHLEIFPVEKKFLRFLCYLKEKVLTMINIPPPSKMARPHKFSPRICRKSNVKQKSFNRNKVKPSERSIFPLKKSISLNQ